MLGGSTPGSWIAVTFPATRRTAPTTPHGRRLRSARCSIADAVPIVLGGDDSIPIPVLAAYEGRGPITVLQVDAHLDFRDEVAGVRNGYSSPMRRASEMEHVDDLFQVGLRGVGSARARDVADARARGNTLSPPASCASAEWDGCSSSFPRAHRSSSPLISTGSIRASVLA